MAKFTFEYGAYVLHRAEAGLLGDDATGQNGGRRQPPGDFETNSLDFVVGRSAKMMLQSLVDRRPRNIKMADHVGDVDSLSSMLANETLRTQDERIVRGHQVGRFTLDLACGWNYQS